MGKLTAWQSWDEYRNSEQWAVNLPKGGDIPWALFYPADYSIGASNLGMHYVFRRLRELGVAVERFFAEPIPYRSADNDTLIERFRVITATIAYEVGVETFFKWLNGAGIPLNSEKREKGSFPLIGAGGALTYINPLILSGVCDFIILGDGMDVLAFVADAFRHYENIGDSGGLLRTLASNDGILVPKFDIKDGEVITSKKIEKTQALSAAYPMHSTWVTPKSAFGNTFLIELQRGCFRNCRYCTLPQCFGKWRRRDFSLLQAAVTGLADKIDFDQVGLVTPEAGDYPDLNKVLKMLEATDKGVSFASLRIDRLSENMLRALSHGGRHSITVAPETGRDELRKSCGKNFDNNLIIKKLKLAKEFGITNAKLYFMIGLPNETDDDITAIAGLCKEIIDNTALSLVISAGPFIPKPCTPWQGENFIGVAEVKRKYKLLGTAVRKIKNKTPQMRLTSPKEAEAEYVLAWVGYNESVVLAREIEKYGKRKFNVSDREKTRTELSKLGLGEVNAK